jgi:WD40 repeat protein
MQDCAMITWAGNFLARWRAREIGQISMVTFLAQKTQLVFAALILAVAGLVMPANGQTPSLNSDAPILDSQGDPLPSGAVARLGSIRLRPGHVVQSVLFSGDGNGVITCDGYSPDIKFWDPISGQLKRTLACYLTEADLTRLGKRRPKPPQAPDSDDSSTLIADFITLAPDGIMLAEITNESCIWLWDLTSGKPLGDLQQPEMGRGRIASVVFSPDGKTLLGVGFGSRICEWDVQTRKLRLEFGPRGLNWGVVFSPDGKTIASSNENSITLWDFATKKQLWSVPNLFTNSGTSLAFSRDCMSLVTGRFNGAIRVLETASGKEKFNLKGHDGPVLSVAASPDGRLLASGANDTILRIWDLATGKQVRECHGNCDKVRTVAFSPDGKTLASGGDDRSLRIWDVQSGEERFPLPGHRNLVLSLAYSPDDRSLASVSPGDGLRIWNLATHQEARSFIPVKDAWKVAIAADNRTVAVSNFNVIVLYDAASGKELRTLQGHRQRIAAMQFLPDGKNLISICYEGPVYHWRIEDGKDVLHSPGARLDLSYDRPFFSADARLLATSGGVQKVAPVPGEQSFVQLHEAHAAKDVTHVNGQNAADTMLKFQTKAFSPDGELLATENIGEGNADQGSILLWNTRSGYFIRSLDYEVGSDSYLAFSPDGRILASSKRDVLYLWEVASGEMVRAWKGHAEGITCIAFANGGRLLASGDHVGDILEWDCTCRSERGVSAHQKAAPDQFEALWKALAKPAAEAEPARWKLVDAGQQAVEFLARCLSPAPAVTAEQIKTLVRELEADSFAVRDRAQRELMAIADVARPALEERVSGTTSPEGKRRIQKLLKDLEAPPSVYFREMRAVSVLAAIESPAAVKLLRELAKGQPGARLTLAAAEACRRLDNRRVPSVPRPR